MRHSTQDVFDAWEIVKQTVARRCGKMANFVIVEGVRIDPGFPVASTEGLVHTPRTPETGGRKDRDQHGQDLLLGASKNNRNLLRQISETRAMEEP